MAGCTLTPEGPRVVLRQPVEWEAYGPEAFARAEAEGKLILLNVSAGWCHWCHVMDERTFAHHEVTRLLRASFVTIRADADASPDLAERYARWGWPANAVLTPDARPILERRGYQPPRRFLALLQDLVTKQRAGDPLAREAEPPPRLLQGPFAELRARVEAQLDGHYDPDTAGWGRGKQKYPWSAPVEHAFLRAWLRPGEARWRAEALRTLEAELALLDPAWGGMYQYSDDGSWSSPHYEKIVSVQAGALENFALAHRLTGERRWLDAAHGIQRYLLRFLRDPVGGPFFASQDAEPPAASRKPGGPSDGSAYFALSDLERERYGVPRVDRAVYAETNGLLIAALARLYQADGRDDTLEQAVTAAEAILATHRREQRVSLGPGDEAGPHWVFAHSPAQADGLVHLADQVAMGQALLALHQVTGAARWLEGARRTARGLRIELEDLEAGGFFARSLDPAARGVFATRRKPFVANARAARFLLQLAAIDEAPAWEAAADGALRALAEPTRIRRMGRIVGEYLLALEERTSPPWTLKVLGRAREPATCALLTTARAQPFPNALVTRRDPGGSSGFPADARPAILLCAGQRCSAPLRSADELAQAAAGFREDGQ